MFSRSDAGARSGWDRGSNQCFYPDQTPRILSAMNTRLTYLYRDACNYKQWHEVVLAGVVDAAAVRASLWEAKYFLPQVVGLPALQARFAAQGYEFPTADDQVWHELVDISPTDDSPTPGIQTQDVMAAFRDAATRGWEQYFAEATKVWRCRS